LVARIQSISTQLPVGTVHNDGSSLTLFHTSDSARWNTTIGFSSVLVFSQEKRGYPSGLLIPITVQISKPRDEDPQLSLYNSGESRH
jgi:hypothetical protein